MESIGDYIYIIVILIAGISSILGKRRKKREAEHETESFPDLEDIIPEFTEYVQPERPVYQNLENRQTGRSKPVHDMVNNVSAMKDKKQFTPVKKHTELPSVAQESSFLSEIEMDNADEVKKAFIYSEIFNRKYT